jgi:hypothetical protein
MVFLQHANTALVDLFPNQLAVVTARLGQYKKVNLMTNEELKSSQAGFQNIKSMLATMKRCLQIISQFLPGKCYMFLLCNILSDFNYLARDKTVVTEVVWVLCDIVGMGG